MEIQKFKGRFGEFTLVERDDEQWQATMKITIWGDDNSDCYGVADTPKHAVGRMYVQYACLAAAEEGWGWPHGVDDK